VELPNLFLTIIVWKDSNFTYDENAWWNHTPYKIEYKGEIECYDKINELHPKYPVII